MCVGRERRGERGEGVVWCRCCVEKPSAIYHESSRTQPKLERKCDVSVGMCWGVLLVRGLVWCGWLLCFGSSVVVW